MLSVSVELHDEMFLQRINYFFSLMCHKFLNCYATMCIARYRLRLAVPCQNVICCGQQLVGFKKSCSGSVGFSSCQFVAAEVVTSAVLGPSLAVPLRSASMWPRIDRPVNGNASLLRWQKCTIMLDFSAEFDIACVWFWPRVCSGFFWLWIGWKSGKAVIGNEFH